MRVCVVRIFTYLVVFVLFGHVGFFIVADTRSLYNVCSCDNKMCNNAYIYTYMLTLHFIVLTDSEGHVRTRHVLPIKYYSRYIFTSGIYVQDSATNTVHAY